MAIKWRKPGLGFLKPSSDWSSRENTGPGGCRGSVKNENGMLIAAYAFNLGEVEVETDSLLLIQWITDTSKPPWRIWDDIKHNKRVIKFFEATIIQHTYRKGTHVVDRLANYGVQFIYTEWFSTPQKLPIEIRGEYKMDILEFPCFRRTKKLQDHLSGKELGNNLQF
ncbi:hypothetical protein MTR67_035407 [Solanum verrucosum]|uniref:RNase H type-1 domain-containing protein n=1 Tax=Solanum verrucosum TaxID=315347 RepID=A0AAF0U9W1_SOLVR|nr:hypothetical protein MTR67_035407 [Solanum verrucosum]